MIDNVDQDEWFNLPLFRFMINWSSWNWESRSWTQGVSTQSWAEINSFEGEDPKPVPRSLTEEGSVRGRSLQSSSSTRSTKIRTCLTSHGGTCLSNLSQRKLFVVRLRTDRTRIFQSQCSCQRTGNEVLILF